MPTFTPAIRKGQLLRGRYETRTKGRALGDSFMGTDCFGKAVELVYWQHNPSGRDVHTCKGHVSAFVVIDEA